jgi:hypothetical protein
MAAWRSRVRAEVETLHVGAGPVEREAPDDVEGAVEHGVGARAVGGGNVIQAAPLVILPVIRLHQALRLARVTYNNIDQSRDNLQ